MATAVTLARSGSYRRRYDAESKPLGDLRTIISDEKLPIKLATLDVDDDASVSDAFNKVFAEHGRIDVLVNNTGVPAIGSIQETPIATFSETMETNFFGGLRCIKAVSPFVVAEPIRQIVDGDSWRLRYLVAADAEAREVAVGDNR